MQAIKSDVQKVETSASQLAELSRDLDLDIARVAVSCAQTEDSSLMAELSDTIPEDHAFKDCVRHMRFAMDTSKQKPGMGHFKMDVRTLKEDMNALLRDITEITFDLGGESEARMDLMEMLIRYLPADRILDFLLEMENHHRESVSSGRNYGPVPEDSDVFSRLTVIRLKAAELES
jgi:hypothetical protein